MQGTQVEDEGKNEREESERAIESTLEELTDEVTTETELVPGEPARTILQYADDTWSTFGRVLVSIGEWRKGGPAQSRPMGAIPVLLFAAWRRA
ncbi:hypothetical protein ACLI4U_04765 [Natrialbaceae archaeon A-CW2]